MGQPGGGESQTKRVFLTRKCPRTFDRTFSNKGSPAMFYFLTLQAPYPFSLVYIFHFRYELVNRSYIFSRDGEIYIYFFFFLSPFLYLFTATLSSRQVLPASNIWQLPQQQSRQKKRKEKMQFVITHNRQKKHYISPRPPPLLIYYLIELSNAQTTLILKAKECCLC